MRAKKKRPPMKKVCKPAASRRGEGAVVVDATSGVSSVIASVVEGQRCLRCDGAIAVEDTAHWERRTLLHCDHCEVVYEMVLGAGLGGGMARTLTIIEPGETPALYKASLADIAAARRSTASAAATQGRGG